jgi:hypothetical protein
VAKTGPDPDAGRTSSNEHAADSDVDESDRVAERAREDAPGPLGRLWGRLRALLGRD